MYDAFLSVGMDANTARIAASGLNAGWQPRKQP
jgi:hypothetical protein